MSSKCGYWLSQLHYIKHDIKNKNKEKKQPRVVHKTKLQYNNRPLGMTEVKKKRKKEGPVNWSKIGNLECLNNYYSYLDNGN